MIYILPTDTCYGIACAFDDKKNYEKIYKIKKRSHDKPLAIMVKNFQWLRDNTDLTDEQVDFLERYEKPFTVLTHSRNIELFLEYADDNEDYFINKDVYEQIAFRVAHNGMQESLINEVGPIWLTSANLSGAGETYDIAKIDSDFEYYIEKWVVEVMGTANLDPEVPASDIFSFEDDSLDIKYLRKG